MKEYYRNNVCQSIGIDEVNSATNSLFAYMKHNTPLNDQFSERDKAHMVDVRSLIKKAGWAYYACIVVIVLLFYIMHQSDSRVFLRNAANTFVTVGILAGGMLSFAYLAGRNFSGAFTVFHKLLFDNDLWLLDPKHDLLIRLFPEQFFYDFAAETMRRTAISCAILVVIAFAFYYFSFRPFRKTHTRQRRKL